MNQHKNMVYGHFVNEKAGITRSPAYQEVIPELMESWEWSPDRLQLTFKMRQNVKWHNRAPVSGRAFDSSYAAFSWNRYSTTAPLRGLVANSANPTAPFLSITATDARTVTAKLKEPLAYALSQLASFGSFDRPA